MRCPFCRERLSGRPERWGARCPWCREPLYEEEDRPRRRRQEPGQCAVHPDSAAYHTCGRCGNFMCQVCRTHWRHGWLCISCVNFLLEHKETAPGEAAAHLRGALIALVLGALSWFIVLGGVLLAVAGVETRNILLVGAGGLVLLASPVFSVLGVGQGLAALRLRGSHMILATMGLVLSGLHVGTIIGLLTFSLSQN